MVEGENQFHNQRRQEEEKPRYRNVEHMMVDVAKFAALPYDGIPGISAIRQEFRGTPLAEVFEDFPEGSALPANAVLDRIDTHLNRARKHITVTEGQAWRRWVTMDYWRKLRASPKEYDEFRQDRKHRRELVAAADSIRQAVVTAVPGLQLDEDNYVHFTPAVKSERQLILHQTRRYYVQEPQDVVRVLEDQYTVLERGADLTWQQRGSLPFLTIETFPEDPDDMEDRMYKVMEEKEMRLSAKEIKLLKMKRPLTKAEEALKRELVDRQTELYWQMRQLEVESTERRARVLPTPNPLLYFNPGAEYKQELDAYHTDINAEVYAPLPQEFNFPEPTAIGEDDSMYDEI